VYFVSGLVLSAWSCLIVAIAAIHWSTFARLKRHLGVLTALGANGWEHLAWKPVGTVSIAFRFSCLAAREAAFWLVGITLGSEELLFLSGEGEVGSAIGALEGFVRIAQWMTSSPLY